MTITRPAGVKAKGTCAVAVVATIAVPGAPDLSSEINAAGSLVISCYLYGDHLPVTNNQDKLTDERMCDDTLPEVLGPTTWSMDDIQYAIDIQAALTTDAAAKLTPGLLVWFVVRYGLAAKTVEFAAGDIVDVIPVELGSRIKVPSTSDAGGKWTYQQKVGVRDAPTFNVAVVA